MVGPVLDRLRAEVEREGRRASGLQEQVNAWFMRAESAEAERDVLRARLAKVKEVIEVEPSDSEPAGGVTFVACTPDGGERWTEYGVQVDDGRVPWVHAEEGFARIRAEQVGGTVVGSTVTRSRWLPVDSEPAPDADREGGER